MSDDDRPLGEVLTNRLMSHGVYVQEVSAGDDLSLTYESVAPGDGVPHDEVGSVLRTLLDVTDGTWSGDVAATVLDDDGDVRGTWRAEAAWFERLHDDLTEVEFSGRVLDTIENA